MFTVEMAGLSFSLECGLCIVREAGKEVSRFSMLDAEGLPTVCSQKEFEDEVMWWLYFNGGI